jgi:glyoxalase/bleomycin resistance protein/dioxygenase superfamily protein
MTDMGGSFGTLDYVYAPSADVAADARWFTDVLGAELEFAIDDGGTRVAMLRVATDGPALLLTDHLPDARPVLVYRVDDLAATTAGLRSRGWTAERTIELPPGPCTTFAAPGGLRLAIYQPSRPFVVESFGGRRDF